MHILAMANASTFIAHRKYFRFWRVFLLKNQGNGELCILTQVSQVLPHTPVTVGSGRVEFTCESSILIRLQVKVG